MPDTLSSSPCSVPPWLRRWFPEESVAQKLVCATHDEAYKVGGSQRLRLLADARFLVQMLEADEGTALEMDAVTAERYFTAVRTYGHLAWGTPSPITYPVPTVPESP